MTNVFYMCFGILVFVLGQLFQRFYEKRYLTDTYVPRTTAPRIKAPNHEEQYESFIELPDEGKHTAHLHEDAPDCEERARTIQTYDNIIKTSTTPPTSNSEGLYEYTPSLYEDIDVEIMTPEREREIYKRANMLGGV